MSRYPKGYTGPMSTAGGVRSTPTRPTPAPRNKAPKPAPTKQRTPGQMQTAATKRRLAAQQRAAERRQIGNAVNRGVGGPTPTQQQRQQLSKAASNYTQNEIKQRQLADMDLAQQMSPARGPTQQARMAPAGSTPPAAARQMSAAEAQKITRTRPKGFAKGGVMKANAGASMKPNRKAKK